MKELNVLTWHVDKQCLVISLGGTSIVMEGVDLEFAEAFANGLDLSLIQMATPYVAPDVAPRTVLQKRDVIVKLWKYPQHPDNRS